MNEQSQYTENKRTTLDLKKEETGLFDTKSAITKPLTIKNKSIKTAQSFIHSPASPKKLKFISFESSIKIVDQHNTDSGNK